MLDQDDLSDYEQSPTLLADLVPDKPKELKSTFELYQFKNLPAIDITEDFNEFFKNLLQTSDCENHVSRISSQKSPKKSRTSNNGKWLCKYSMLSKKKSENKAKRSGPKISTSLKPIPISKVFTRSKIVTIDPLPTQVFDDSRSIVNAKEDESQLQESYSLDATAKILEKLFQNLSSYDSGSNFISGCKMKLKTVRDVLEKIDNAQIKESNNPLTNFNSRRVTLQTLFHHHDYLINIVTELDKRNSKITTNSPQAISESIEKFSEARFENSENLFRASSQTTEPKPNECIENTLDDDDSETTASAPETHWITSNIIPESEEIGCILEKPVTQPHSSKKKAIDLSKLKILPNEREEFIPLSTFENKTPGFWDLDVFINNPIPKYLEDEIDQW